MTYGLMNLSEIIQEIAQSDRSGKRAPRPKRGQICLKWGKIRHMDPDLVVAGGDGTARCDRSLVMSAFTSPDYHPLDAEWGPSFLEKLHTRGYDLTTLEFRISKR